MREEGKRVRPIPAYPHRCRNSHKEISNLDLVLVALGKSETLEKHSRGFVRLMQTQQGYLAQ